MYDEKISDYIIAGYEFSNVHSLEISRMDLKKFSELAIYSHKVIARPEGDFSFRLEVLQGAGEPSSVISFLFNQYKKL